jgi:hypothetical protein
MDGHFKRETFWMWSLPGAVLAIGLAGAVAGTCVFARRDRAKAERDLEHILKLCEQIALPNSMARPPGLDINAHLAALAEERERLVVSLRTPTAIDLTRKLLRSEQDALRRHCLEQLLADTSN